jgi:hypothetical protein
MPKLVHGTCNLHLEGSGRIISHTQTTDTEIDPHESYCESYTEATSMCIPPPGCAEVGTVRVFYTHLRKASTSPIESWSWRILMIPKYWPCTRKGAAWMCGC